MARFNFPSRLPRGGVVGIDAFPSNLVTDRRNFYTEMNFVRYQPPFGGTAFGQLAGDITAGIGEVASDIGQTIENIFNGNFNNPEISFSREIDSSIMRLPIPRKLNESHMLTWNERSVTDMITSFGSGLLNLRATRRGLTDEQRNTAITRAQRFNSLQRSSGLSAFTGVAINPFLFIYFDRPNFKRFSFTWTLAARNSEESQKIKDIVIRLKKQSSPRLNGIFMAYPDILNIRFYPDDVFGMLRLKPCIVENVMVDYTPAGPSFFGDTDAPTLVSLTLNLKEIELWEQDDPYYDSAYVSDTWFGASEE